MRKIKIQRWENLYADTTTIKHDYFDLFFRPIKLKAINFLVSDINKDNKILEIGCGSGQMVDYFTKQGFSATGIDINEEIIKKSHAEGNLICGDVHQMPFPECSFSAIYSFSVLQYCNIEQVISECHRVLLENGKIVMIENMGKNPFAMFYRYVHNRRKWKYPDFQTPKKYFDWRNRKKIMDSFQNVNFIPYHLTTPFIMYAFRVLPDTRFIFTGLKYIYYLFNFLDLLVLKVFPFLSKYCWRVLIYAEK
jgi:ubiquinone/menaquinone biosynthesis C-methylase UbiE